jgi:hypothetical protein
MACSRSEDRGTATTAVVLIKCIIVLNLILDGLTFITMINLGHKYKIFKSTIRSFFRYCRL